jgi:hypothetical protein
MVTSLVCGVILGCIGYAIGERAPFVALISLGGLEATARAHAFVGASVGLLLGLAVTPSRRGKKPPG